MSRRLVAPAEALAALEEKAGARWADAICAEYGVGEVAELRVPLRPGVANGQAVESLGYDVWADWLAAWQRFAAHLPRGMRIESRPLSIRRVRAEFPAALVAEGIDAALNAASISPSVPGKDPALPDTSLEAIDLDRARDLAEALVTAGGTLSPATLRRASALSAADAGILCDVIAWLATHDEIDGWTARQLPVPGIHTKWLERHGGLLARVTGRDVHGELRPRPAVVHLTYTDPGYLSSGARRHDAWTTGDVHSLAYQPSTVLVVENRDSRLWFPESPHAIIVEGGGKAAASLLAEIPWIRAAKHLLYWGDIDVDGFEILAQFRTAMAEPSIAGDPPHDVRSVLMDLTALHRYAEYGIMTDKNGLPLKPTSVRLPRLTPAEAAAHDAVATAGDAPFRRIEQELIPLADAARELRTLTT